MARGTIKCPSIDGSQQCLRPGDQCDFKNVVGRGKNNVPSLILVAGTVHHCWCQLEEECLVVCISASNGASSLLLVRGIVG